MKYIYRRKRVDQSQAPIMRALLAAGASVDTLEGRGGRPDLLIGFRGVTYLLECKTPGYTKSHKQHRENQELWRALWRGGPAEVVTTPDEALKAIGAME